MPPQSSQMVLAALASLVVEVLAFDDIYEAFEEGFDRPSPLSAVTVNTKSQPQSRSSLVDDTNNVIVINPSSSLISMPRLFSLLVAWIAALFCLRFALFLLLKGWHYLGKYWAAEKDVWHSIHAERMDDVAASLRKKGKTAKIRSSSLSILRRFTSNFKLFSRDDDSVSTTRRKDSFGSLGSIAELLWESDAEISSSSSSASTSDHESSTSYSSYSDTDAATNRSAMFSAGIGGSSKSSSSTTSPLMKATSVASSTTASSNFLGALRNRTKILHHVGTSTQNWERDHELGTCIDSAASVASYSIGSILFNFLNYIDEDRHAYPKVPKSYFRSSSFDHSSPLGMAKRSSSLDGNGQCSDMDSSLHHRLPALDRIVSDTDIVTNNSTFAVQREFPRPVVAISKTYGRQQQSQPQLPQQKEQPLSFQQDSMRQKKYDEHPQHQHESNVASSMKHDRSILQPTPLSLHHCWRHQRPHLQRRSQTQQHQDTKNDSVTSSAWLHRQNSPRSQQESSDGGSGAENGSMQEIAL